MTRPSGGYADADGFEEVEDWRCAPGCPVADLDRQSGESTSPTSVVRGVGGGEFLAGVRTEKQRYAARRLWRRLALLHVIARDEPRFSYTAKPDNGERDLGLQGMRKVSRAEAVCREDSADKEWVGNPRAGAGSRKGRANIHPTVKPIDLMRWLCRLVTPKDGVVLDPFMGSGTTGVACSREGFRFVGVEREPAYYEIARRRLIGDSPLFNRISVKATVPAEPAKAIGDGQNAEYVATTFLLPAPSTGLETVDAEFEDIP
jgi:hypothetical protein